MTSPYITFEEMEEGVEYWAQNKCGTISNVRASVNYGKLMCKLNGGWSRSDHNPNDLVFIPVYSPPNSWDEYLDDDGDFQIIKNNEGGYFSNRAKNLANDKELLAAIDWLQDELDRRQKAGES